MNPTASNGFESLSAHIGAYVLLSIFLIISISPLNFGLFQDTRPMLLFAAVFYWSLFRPDFLGYLSLFLLGLVFDSFTLTVFGQTAITLIGLRFILMVQRRVLINQPFWMIWLVFGVLCLAAAAFRYVIQTVAGLDIISPRPYFSDAILTAVLFPVLASILKPTADPLKTTA